MADPAGNRTAIVRYGVPKAERAKVAAAIMADPTLKAEQVGFETRPRYGDCIGRLEMAGGEFCGNATMCSAALYMIVNDMPGEANVKVRVSGTKEPLDVRLVRRDAVSFDASVTMPPAVGIDELKLSDGMLPGNDVLRLPVVRMEGIAHVIIEPDSGFFGLKDDSALAETLLRGWCGVLGAECLGMMFLDEGKGVRALTPLVYVPGADTMFWENSCASGSAAAGMYLAAKEGKPVDVTFSEPAGSLRVTSDPDIGRTVLYGSLTLK